jgi:hypothetical protein
LDRDPDGHEQPHRRPDISVGQVDHLPNGLGVRIMVQRPAIGTRTEVGPSRRPVFDGMGRMAHLRA